jgi:hypothetical protein
MSVYRTEHSIERPQYLGGQQWQLRGLTDITVLMGKNGSGKSVLLRAWRDQSPDRIHYVVPERTGEMDFQPHLMMDEFDGTRRRGSASRNFVLEYRRRILSRIHTYFMTRGNFRGEAAAPGNPSELEVLIGSLLPEFDVSLAPTTPAYNLKRISDGKAITHIDQLSSGEAQLLTMTLDMLTIAAIWEIENRPERILLIDEPDAHVHPDFQARFAEFLVRLVDRFALQVVVATHSTTLMASLGQFGNERASVIYIDRARREYTAQRFDRVVLELASCLGGHVLMGPLFGAPLLLVEGDDDYRIWSEVPRHHVVNLSVIPCKGDEIRLYQKRLELILGSLCEKREKPIGFALLDGDKSMPQPSPEKPQNYVRFLQLACREAENLYLTDIVLRQLGHTWESAKKAISNAAGNFGSKRSALESCLSLDRQTVDLKGVINEIARILDPKNLLWSVRVGTAIGRGRPSGELELFLGKALIEALWA